jgi:glycosyltransferase involved in cell wall biosynthesis
MTKSPRVSIVVPCRNEERFIGGCLESILSSGYPHDRMEILVVDGMSTDQTRAIVGEFAARYPQVRLLENRARSTPVALNIGIRNADGEIIMRMDTHCAYPAHYVSRLVGWLERSGADNVGGVCRTHPSSDSPAARAIALGLSNPLGVGNAHFRIGVGKPRWVDTVPFGCYRREVFDRIGLFDEQLVRNQDDELNLRLIQNGGRILLVPDVTSDYYGRESLGKLWRMYYQYGYFKPLVARKVGAVMTVRQLVPAAFVATLLCLALAALWLPFAGGLLTCALGSYAFIVVGMSGALAVRHGVACAASLCVVFPTIHISYGLGYLRGVLSWVLLRRQAPGTDIGISR